MNKDTYQKISDKKFCNALKTFIQLDEKLQDQLIPGLSRRMKSCLNIITAIEAGHDTYESIANAVAMNPQTVQQTTLALTEGGGV